MRAGEFIPNPCDHVMFEHLRYRSTRVEARSSAGNRAEKTLMFNDDESVQYRELVLGLIELAEQKRIRLQETIREVEHQSKLFPERAEALREEKESAQRDLEKIGGYLLKMGGGDSE
jgi:hypothetical protein